MKTLNIPFSDVLKIEQVTDPLNRIILKCVYAAMGFYTEGKGFHADRMVKQFGGGDDIEKIVQKCLPVKESNDTLDDQIIRVEECFKLEKVGGYEE